MSLPAGTLGHSLSSPGKEKATTHSDCWNAKKRRETTCAENRPEVQVVALNLVTVQPLVGTSSGLTFTLCERRMSDHTIQGESPSSKALEGNEGGKEAEERAGKGRRVV